MKLKKVLCGILALSLSATMLVGCGKKDGSGSSNYQMKMEAGEGTKITKDVFEPTMLLQGYDFDSMSVFQEAFKYTNVKPKAYIAVTADAGTAFDTMLTSSEGMADISVASVSKINTAAVEGAFIPLDSLIDEYAPNIKAYFEQYPEYKAACLASDGKLYVIPTTYDTIASEGFFIRKDWLEKLNLEVPTTVDEYYNVLKAFKTQDPNGNGKADEIPFFQRGKTWNSLTQLWGAYPRWYVDENNKVHYGWTEDAMKTAMENIVKWNKEGLIDPELATRQNAREDLLGNNLGGSTHDWFSSTGSFTKTVKESHKGEAWAENFDFSAIMPPADSNGDVKEIYSRPLMRGSGWAISSSNEYVVETIKYFDWWFTEQGKLSYWYGAEGKEYTKDADGNVTFTDLVMDSKNGVPMYMRDIGQLEQGAPMSMKAEMAGMTEGAKEGFAMYESEVDIKAQFPTFTYTAEEIAERDPLATAVTTFVEETTAKWFAGDTELNDAAWDAYISKAKELGVDRLIEIHQQAYDRFVSAGGGLDDPKKNTTAIN